MRGIGYAHHEDFLRYYEAFGEGGIAMFLADKSIPECMRQMVEIRSMEQIRFDRAFVYSGLQQALCRLGPVPALIENKKSLDGFRAWIEIKRKYDPTGFGERFDEKVELTKLCVKRRKQCYM